MSVVLCEVVLFLSLSLSMYESVRNPFSDDRYVASAGSCSPSGVPGSTTHPHQSVRAAASHLADDSSGFSGRKDRKTERPTLATCDQLTSPRTLSCFTSSPGSLALHQSQGSSVAAECSQLHCSLCGNSTRHVVLLAPERISPEVEGGAAENTPSAPSTIPEKALARMLAASGRRSWVHLQEVFSM